MRNGHDALDRLLRCAAGAQAPAPHPGPFAVSRALAAWRAQRREAGLALWRHWARIALGCTAAMTAVSLAVAWEAVRSEGSDAYSESATTSYEVSLR